MKSRTRFVWTGLGLVALIAYLLPVYWMVATALKPSAQVFTDPPTLVPLPPSLEAFGAAVFDNPGLGPALGNSAIIALGTAAVTLLVSVPAAYGLARFRYRFVSVVLMLFLVVQMIPSVNLALPMFAIFSRINLVDTYLALILANAALTIPMCIVIMRPYFLAVPQEILDAARTDGCTSFRAFITIALPVSRPGLITIGALSFLGGWGEYVLGLSLTTSDSMQPVTVLLAGLSTQLGTQWNEVMALSLIVALPILTIFIVLQRYIVGGLTEGSGKS